MVRISSTWNQNVNLSIHLDTVLVVSVVGVWDWRMALWWIDIHLWLFGREYIVVCGCAPKPLEFLLFLHTIFRRRLRIVDQFLSRFMGIIFRFDYFCVDSWSIRAKGSIATLLSSYLFTYQTVPNVLVVRCSSRLLARLWIGGRLNRMSNKNRANGNELWIVNTTAAMPLLYDWHLSNNSLQNHDPLKGDIAFCKMSADVLFYKILHCAGLTGIEE